MTVEFITAIVTRIKTVSALATKTYFEVAPSTAVLPYAIVTYSGSIKNYDMENFAINVDIYGKGPDTTTLEGIVKSVSDALDHYTTTSSTMGMTLFKDNSFMVPDPNENIRHRRLTFQAQTYFK